MSKFLRYFKVGEVFVYFIRVFKKHDPRYPINQNIRIMHGINRISIVMFLICLVVIFVRRCT
ncbi:DUF6728 family protein [Raineya orbicola]|uniref:DUF6728 family protein n=1 Tax=Raineya orbicola TaxID=2016530 RepID=UPI000C6E42E8|nr:DUF6728 family protein [Raineya orbicola]